MWISFTQKQTENHQKQFTKKITEKFTEKFTRFFRACGFPSSRRNPCQSLCQHLCQCDGHAVGLSRSRMTTDWHELDVSCVHAIARDMQPTCEKFTHDDTLACTWRALRVAHHIDDDQQWSLHGNFQFLRWKFGFNFSIFWFFGIRQLEMWFHKENDHVSPGNYQNDFVCLTWH